MTEVLETIEQVAIATQEEVSYTFETAPQKGDKGDTGIVDVLYGSTDPPDPTGIADGTLYIKYL